MFRRFMMLALSIILLDGCVAVWGKAYKVEEQTPDEMTIHYDDHFIENQDIGNLASIHCGKYSKDAVLQTKDKSPWGLTTATYTCTAPEQPTQ